MKSYNDIKEELLHHYKECLERHQKALDEATKNNDLLTITARRRGINNVERSIENIDEATKSYIGKKVNNMLFDIENMSKIMQDDYFNHFDRFSDIFLGNTRDEQGRRNLFGLDLGLTKDDLSLFKGKIASLTTTKDEFITYANQHFGTNIPSCEDMMLMEEFRSKSNISRDEFVHYAEMYRDSGKISYPNGCLMTTVQDMIDDFDGIHKEQVSNKQM